MKLSIRNKIVKTLTITAVLSLIMCGCGQDKAVSDNKEKDLGETADIIEESSGEEEPSTKEDDIKMPVLEAGEISDTYKEAGFILDALSEAKQDNVIYSPLSLHMALGVLNEGAAGTTKGQIDDFLGEDYSTKAADFMSNFNISDEYGIVNVANAIWVDKALKLKKEYKNSVKDSFQAAAENCDFSKPSKAADTINKWCAKQTHDLIDNIIDEAAIKGGQPSAIITNTVYFNQKWSDELFELNEKEDFTNVDGSKTPVNFLSGDGMAYYENDDATAFSYDYMNSFHFIGILPKAEGSFKVSDINIKELLESASYEYDINFAMPPLDYETDNDLLKPALIAMGLDCMFDESKADLSGMSDSPLYVGDVVQKCNIKLDKYGTEASAATALEIMLATAAPFEREKKEVRLDRPYIFLITDPAGEEVLFAGKVDYMVESD